jgi:5-methylthioadenosine/S-adenosylhomocysteine deaminase
MPPERSIEMATINAATALGLDREIGSLEKGKRADIAVFDVQKPYVGVLHRPISNFICASKGSDARLVMVDGVIVYRDGTFARFKECERTILEAENIGRKALDAAGLRSRLEPAWRR